MSWLGCRAATPVDKLEPYMPYGTVITSPDGDGSYVLAKVGGRPQWVAVDLGKAKPVWPWYTRLARWWSGK